MTEFRTFAEAANAAQQGRGHHRCPERTIIESTTPRRRHAGDPINSKPGLVAVSTLECGHILDTNARDRRRGRVPCWDCYYRKPPDRLGAVIAAEHAEGTDRS